MNCYELFFKEELFISSLTVREHLLLQSYLRLPRQFSKEDRQKEVSKVIMLFGLSKCQNNRIGTVGVRKGISGIFSFIYKYISYFCVLLVQISEKVDN